MKLHKFTGVDAFVAVDLQNAPVSSGPVRWAKRILQSGAKDLARSQTYTYAALGMRRGGASAGISAVAAERDGAVSGFVEEARALASSGVYFPDAAKGVSDGDLVPLREADPRNLARLGAFGSTVDALTAVAAADAVAGGLEGRRVVIEGYGAPGVAASAAVLLTAVAGRGGRVVGLSSGTASVTVPSGGTAGGIDPAAAAEVWNDHGDGALDALAAEVGLDAGPAWKLWQHPVEVVFAGSKMGAVKHPAVESLVEGGRCMALVPCGRLAFTAKSLAVCRQNNIAAVPDFVSVCGSTIAAWSDPAASDSDIRRKAVSATSTLIEEALSHEHGPFLGACYAAESFLRTWQDELPFGRPLAA